MKYNGHRKYALFIGRWQPFHNGHKWLVDQALTKGKKVCIAIRETEISEKNPYTAEQRKEMIKRVYEDKVKVISFPDIESIHIGRKVGYEVVKEDPPADIMTISGTKVREGGETRVPQEVAHYIKTLKTTLWLTGLPCAGKTTIAKRLEEELMNRGYRVAHLDGDDVRKKINADLSFSEQGRHENLRRVAHIAQLFNEKGIFVIASFVSPINKYRRMIKDIVENMQLIYVKCSLEECQRRDTKGMYKKACQGQIKDFTGISAPFEDPENPDIVVDTERDDLECCVKQILQKVENKPTLC